MAMVAFGSVQLHQFYLNQKQIDLKIFDLKQRSTEISLSRRSSQTGKTEDIISPTLPDKVCKLDADDVKVTDLDSNTQDESTSVEKDGSKEDQCAEQIAENVSKHSQEMSDHIKNLANTIKENAN